MNLPTIIVDTREQRPYSFYPDRANTMRKKLTAGDYSLEGFENLIAVERKSLDDFVATVIKGRKRFSVELKNLKEYEAGCIVVEASIKDIFDQKYNCHAHPNSVFGAAISIIVDYKIPIFFCSNRQIARAFTEEYLLRFNRTKQVQK